MDHLSPEHRSENMRRIRAKDTSPELAVRRIVHSLGYRYRLHVKDLPGKPDLVLRKRKMIIFVHGCFWHQHSNCRNGRLPSSRTDYWQPKLERNQMRDLANEKALTSAGWDVVIIWECETRNLDKLRIKISEYFGTKRLDFETG